MAILTLAFGVFITAKAKKDRSISRAEAGSVYFLVLVFAVWTAVVIALGMGGIHVTLMDQEIDAADTEEDAGSSAYPEPETIDWAMLLPDGPGKGRVLAYCTGCHGLKIVVQARKSRDAWFNNITWMTDDFGAPVPEEEIPLLADYLSQHYSQK